MYYGSVLDRSKDIKRNSFPYIMWAAYQFIYTSYCFYLCKAKLVKSQCVANGSAETLNLVYGFLSPLLKYDSQHGIQFN